ncbi:hypothetical protein [Mesorhizobium sp. B1-1-5]|nr:hypothetical protein [Mesorhizobium sp. B1-1-5]
MLGALMRAGVPYLAAIATEAEPRIRLLLDHTLFRYRLKVA